MRYLSQHDLGGHGNCGEGIALLERGGRRYLYLAHERGPANFSVLDVTDPRAPQLLTQTMLPHGGVRSNSLAVSGELLVVAYQVDTPGERPAGIEVYDLSRPAEVGRWWLPGTQQGDGSPPPVRHEVFDAGFRDRKSVV